MNELEGKRLLIVEDDVANMAVYSAVLRRSGAIVIRDYWSTDTVNIVKQNLPIDIILLDLMLRYHVNGYDTFDKIKAEPDLADIPVVIVSAADPGIEIPKAKDKGVNGFIGKPINPERFSQQILDCISGKPVWYAASEHLEDF